MKRPAQACFNCPLADCDEASPQCELRRVWNVTQRKIRTGRNADITPDERASRNAFYTIWKLDHEAKIAEARR